MDKETEKEAAKEIAIAQLNKRNTETVEVVFPIGLCEALRNQN